MDEKDKLKEGTKFDDGKLRFDLIPSYPLHCLAEVYTIGSRKYADNNWRKGLKWSRVFGAMMRHAWAFWTGESYDSTDGQHHLASVAWCAFALMEYEKANKEFDDRVCPVPPNEALLRTKQMSQVLREGPEEKKP